MLRLVKNGLIILCILGFFYFLLFHVFDLKTVIMKQIYPQKYAEYVNEYAEQYGVDPLLIFAMIKIESNFNADAKSSSEARGLMQLMENTATETAQKIEEQEKNLQSQEVAVANHMQDENTEVSNHIEEGIQELYEPEKNIQLGTYYFSSLLTQYQNTGIALAAYNAGMGRVNEWIEKGTILPDGSNLEAIPFQETNMYVRKVLNAYRIYQELYGS